MTPALRLERISPDNVTDACRLTVRPEQRKLVAPVAHSLAEAYAMPEVAWPRLVYAGEELVAFVMACFDPDNAEEAPRCAIWRLNVAAAHQGEGYGRFAVESLLAEGRRRGNSRMFVSWVPGEHSPEGFYLKLGFRPTGQVLHGETVAVIDLCSLTSPTGQDPDRTASIAAW